MQMDAPEMREGQIHIMELKKTNARELAHVIKALMFRENGNFDVTKNGMRIIVDDQLCEQAIAYLPFELFTAYTIREPNVNFRIPLHLLTDCMNMLDGSTTMIKMTYDGFGEPLRVLLEEDGVVVQTNIHTLTPQPILEFDFDGDDIAARVFLKASFFKDTIKELDTSSPSVTIFVSDRRLSFITQGDMSITTTIPSYSEQVEKLECSAPVSHRYKLTLIKRMSSALTLSNKVVLRIDSRGVLSVQLMIDQSEGDQVYIEFYVIPDHEDYD